MDENWTRPRNSVLSTLSTLGEVDDAAAEVHDITNGGADVSADALGIATTCRNAVNSLRKGGTHVQIGLTTSEEGMGVAADRRNRRQKIEFKGITRPPALPIQRDAGYDRVRQTRSDNACREKIDIHSVPDELAAMSDYDTLGIPVCNEFSS